ncbi:MAG TPA: BamA/TamA family outer membrane protein [Gemmatimonadaceae bacterium]
MQARRFRPTTGALRACAGCGGALVALLAVARPAAAQVTGTNVACAGQEVSEIQISTKPPYYPKNGKWWETPLGILASLHVDTKPDVIRRFLLLQPGMPCDEQRRAESERILRAQPFIADATIRAFDDGRGGVILSVLTTDELTPIVGATTSGKRPYVTSLKLGEGNLLGTGRLVSAQWGSGELRDTYGAHITDYQFFGRPWMLDLVAIRQDAGIGGWSVDVSHPYLTDQQRIAWRVSAGDRRDLFDFLRGDLEPVTVGIDRHFSDIGGVVRVGAPGRLSLFGLSFSSESDTPGLPPVLDPSIPYDSLLQRFGRRRNARVNLLWGVRSIGFRRARHFDALTAYQDVRVGFQLGTLIGRSLSVLGTRDDDLLLAGDLYAGVGGPHTFMSLQAAAEGRQDYDANSWDGIIGSAHIALYHQLGTHHTLVSNFDWGGGWKQRIPLQLRLGQIEGGVRGYRDSRDAGAIRAVARLEDRWYLGKIRDQAAVGLALFTDAGRLWAGDVPYGVSTPVKVGAGIGLLAALPPGSRRTWRVDVAFPLSPDGHARWEVRLWTMNAAHLFEREPRDLRFSRERVVPSSVFQWP